MIPVWGIIRGLFFGGAFNGFNNILMLSMIWTVFHQWYRVKHFPFKYYRISVLLLEIYIQKPYQEYRYNAGVAPIYGDLWSDPVRSGGAY